MAHSPSQKEQFHADVAAAVKLINEHQGNVLQSSFTSGIPRGTLQARWMAAIRLGLREAEAPMSEDEAKFKPEWTPQDCINELQRIAKIDTTKVISRNYFRNNAVCSESTWNRYFGTFAEFKRQATIVLSRQQHKLERDIAKHASVDHYRALNDERGEYAAKYEKPSARRFKTILRASDLHDIECDEFFLRVLIDTAKRVQPDVICLNGDVFDLPEFSKFSVDPRQWDVVGRIQFVHNSILAPLRAVCPNAQIDLIEGNHEFRILRHMADATPALKAILSDLHGFTVGKLLGLDKFEINYIAKGDLAAYTLRDVTKEVGSNYKVYYDTVLAHHFPEGRSMGLPGFNGHHHTWKVWDEYSHKIGSYQWVQGGCGHTQDATYANGRKWALEFGLVHVDTQSGKVQHECFPFADTFVVVGGKYYERS
jgi:hypothetical protein